MSTRKIGEATISAKIYSAANDNYLLTGNFKGTSQSDWVAPGIAKAKNQRLKAVGDAIANKALADFLKPYTSNPEKVQELKERDEKKK